MHMPADYKPLALKYRPRKFSQVIGQEAAVTTLRGMVRTGKIPNLIILHGPTGCGKTTLARILGRYVNCQADGGVDQCDGCDSCRSFKKDRHPDIRETDGGTFSKIENVREMQKVVGLASRYNRTIRIMDEVHALSGPAWTACLKTFEEPPPGVTFVLCTTDLPKLPAAIQGRAVIITLSTLSEKVMAAWLRKVAQREGYPKFTAEMAAQITYFAQQHPRNALNALERVLLALQAGGTVDLEKEATKVVEKTLGLTPWRVIDLYLKSILCGHARNALKLAGAVYTKQKKVDDADEHKQREEQIAFKGKGEERPLESYFFMQQACASLRAHICARIAPELVEYRFRQIVRENHAHLKDWEPAQLVTMLDLFIRAHERLKTFVVPEADALALVTLQALAIRGFKK
jgi:DNA polymerase III subunit gamma/tau